MSRRAASYDESDVRVRPGKGTRPRTKTRPSHDDAEQGMVVSVEKAIRQADLGLNPIVDGQTLRIPVPPLTEERRKDLVKLAGKYAEQQKIAVRNVRRDGMEQVKGWDKKHEVSEDEAKQK